MINKMGNVPLKGLVKELKVVNKGFGYNETENIPTLTSNKANILRTNEKSQVAYYFDFSKGYFNDLGPYKVDNLLVNLEINNKG
jgi:hypothetical protein